MDHIVPGPIIPFLLNLQDDHVSTTIWNGGEVTFRARYNLWPQVHAEPVLQVIRNTAFGKILDIGSVEINNHLITALVERWRSEMHTFHLPIGECTVTLEDVAYQLGLPIDGDVVTGPTNMDWNVVCHNLLGAVPNERQIVGQQIQMSCLDSTFQQLSDDATEISWAYDRIPMLAPRLNVPTTFLFPLVRRWSQHLVTTNILGHATNIIRSMLDRLRIDQFVWTPYQNFDFMGQIPDMARSRVPLICFAIVEWHDADRVMTQFSLQQPIPQDPINVQKQHKMDLRGKNDYNWQQKHDQWIQIWNHREYYVMNGLPSVQLLHHYSQYMQWYLQRTRKYISPDGAYSSGSCNEMMDAFAKLLPTAFSDSNYQAPPTNQFDMSVAPEFQQPFESQTQMDTHPQAFTQQTPVP
ncbi:hypothetical protein Lal_00036130 [Lupinus albus]|nr:hypothetical protein Lal_00036130 [Lupinus albus]